MMAGSLLFAMVDFYPSQPLDFSLDLVSSSGEPWHCRRCSCWPFLCWRFLPELPFFNRLVLATQSPTGPSMQLRTPSIFEPSVKVGEEGVARTILRPAGKAEFGAALVDVVTDGEFSMPARGSALRWSKAIAWWSRDSMACGVALRWLDPYEKTRRRAPSSEKTIINHSKTAWLIFPSNQRPEFLRSPLAPARSSA